MMKPILKFGSRCSKTASFQNNAPSNKSLDVRAKQRLFLHIAFLPYTCVLAVSLRFISSVRLWMTKPQKQLSITPKFSILLRLWFSFGFGIFGKLCGFTVRKQAQPNPLARLNTWRRRKDFWKITSAALGISFSFRRRSVRLSGFICQDTYRKSGKHLCCSRRSWFPLNLYS